MQTKLGISATFLQGVVDPTNMPHFNLPEVALLGRSNVGKSTLINRLTNDKGLAHVSATPGKTKEVNLFKVERKGVPLMILADLPGFGYAKMSKVERINLSDLILSYLENRKALSLICLLNDIRRDPEDEEIMIRDSAFSSGIPLIVILTKADKLSNNELAKARKKLAALYNLEVEDMFTTGTDTSVQPLWHRILGQLQK